MTILGLLRHGEVTGGVCFRGHQDDPLSNKGLDQMRDSVKTTKWDGVVTSPLKRCAEFAKLVSQQQGIPLETNKDLMEIYFGEWEGRTAAELMDETPELLTKFWQDPDQNPPPGGEKLSAFAARVMRAKDTILKQAGEQRILLVTHAGVIRILLCHDRQIPLINMFDIDVVHGGLYIST
ncbi:MAG: alpha-ribazole phosphatase family protein [Gammaproteobacteria bacterium]|nr:alpha-ribazole phosphatase family protein [Gammaproteobacteria bacterium]